MISLIVFETVTMKQERIIFGCTSLERPATLYIAHPANAPLPCKIGITYRRVKDRLQELQTGSPLQLVISTQFQFSSLREAYIVEQTTLHFFNDKRMCGEWLNCDVSTIAKQIPSICRNAFPLFSKVFEGLGGIECKPIKEDQEIYADTSPKKHVTLNPGGQILRNGLAALPKVVWSLLEPHSSVTRHLAKIMDINEPRYLAALVAIGVSIKNLKAHVYSNVSVNDDK